MRLVYRDQALDDLDWVRNYYISIFPEGARRASLQFLASEQGLLDNPFLGRALDATNARQYQIARTPFSIIYRIEKVEIQVLRIWDSRSDPNRKLEI
jgi:plasmid stabilization system protein ParE